MSDDDRDIDVESDEDDEGTTSPTNLDGTQFMTQAEKRAHHNALERKRRDHIKESFSGLRDAIPSMHGEKVSRAQVLKKATDYIQYMRRKNNTHQQDIDDLRRQNDLLDQQVRALEKARSAGTYVSQATDANKHFDGGSGSDSSEPGLSAGARRKKIKTK